MKQSTSFGIITALTLGLGISVFALFEKTKELEHHKDGAAEMSMELQKYKNENRRLRVVANILDGATYGIHDAKAETIENVNKVVAYILDLKDAPEEKFKECWDRELETTSWGSMGPYGLLDACIDSIKSSRSAIFIRKIDIAARNAYYDCANGDERLDRAKNCAADRNFRLMSTANGALFSAITEANWLDTLAISINTHDSRKR